MEWKSDRINGAGRYVTASAIKELNQGQTDVEATFTLKQLHDLYMKHYKDPTEISFVNEVFDGDLQHWRAMVQSKMFAPYYAMWKEEADLRLLSDNIKLITSIANDSDNKGQLGALKYLADRGFSRTEEETKRGRPSKAEVDKKLKQMSEEAALIEADVLRVIEGGRKTNKSA